MMIMPRAGSRIVEQEGKRRSKRENIPSSKALPSSRI